MGLAPSRFAALKRDRKIGDLSGYTCPECTGPLFEIQDGQLLRFRCRVGHAYTAASMIDEKDDILENALYTALNTLEENAGMTAPWPRGRASKTTATPPAASRNGPATWKSARRPSARCSPTADRGPGGPRLLDGQPVGLSATAGHDEPVAAQEWARVGGPSVQAWRPRAVISPLSPSLTS